MTPSDPQDDITADLPDTDTPSAGIDPNHSPDTPPEPEGETDEEWARRFIEENVHLMAPPQPWHENR